MTLSQVIALHGGDFEEVMRQRAHELAVMDDLGIVLDSDPSAVDKAGQSQNPPVEETPHPEQHGEEESS